MPDINSIIWDNRITSDPSRNRYFNKHVTVTIDEEVRWKNELNIEKWDRSVLQGMK